MRHAFSFFCAVFFLSQNALCYGVMLTLSNSETVSVNFEFKRDSKEIVFWTADNQHRKEITLAHPIATYNAYTGMLVFDENLFNNNSHHSSFRTSGWESVHGELLVSAEFANGKG